MMNQTIINNEENNEIIECPICMDEITEGKNKVTTDCGHCFHTTCLMKNVAHNGFSCPYCRDVMAEEPPDNNSDEEYDDFSFDEEEEGPDYSDNVLRGARWLFQRAEGEELDDEEDSVLEEEEEEENNEQLDRPSVEYIVQKLVQRGVTMADVVKSILLSDHPEYQDNESFEREDNELFGKFRIIISNYQPPAPQPVVVVDVPLENNIKEEVVLSVQEAMCLVHRGPIYKSVMVDRNDADFEKFAEHCANFHISEKEQNIQMPFSFQMKGSCRRNEVD
jgi:hypothetical protein